jgi:hypothetical protein
MPQPDCLVKATSRKKPAVRKRHTRDQTAAESLKKLATRTVDTFPGPEGSHPWPSRVRWQTPEAGSQSRIVWSPLPDARSRPSFAKATDQTEPLQISWKN